MSFGLLGLFLVLLDVVVLVVMLKDLDLLYHFRRRDPESLGGEACGGRSYHGNTGK